MFKKFTLYFKAANYLILLHGIGHFFGHFSTFVNYQKAPEDIIDLFESMQSVSTSGGNGIWDLFLMFSVSYTVFQVMIAILNLMIVYSNEVSIQTLKKVVLLNLVLWIMSYTVFSLTSVISITMYSQAVFISLFLVAYVIMSFTDQKG